MRVVNPEDLVERGRMRAVNPEDLVKREHDFSVRNVLCNLIEAQERICRTGDAHAVKDITAYTLGLLDDYYNSSAQAAQQPDELSSENEFDDETPPRFGLPSLAAFLEDIVLLLAGGTR